MKKFSAIILSTLSVCLSSSQFLEAKKPEAFGSWVDLRVSLDGRASNTHRPDPSPLKKPYLNSMPRHNSASVATPSQKERPSRPVSVQKWSPFWAPKGYTHPANVFFGGLVGAGTFFSWRWLVTVPHLRGWDRALAAGLMTGSFSALIFQRVFGRK